MPLDPLPSKYSSWDRPSLQADRSFIEASMVEPSQMASCFASGAPHSGDWLLALPIANCGLKLEDEAVRVAVSMRLGLDLCVPHKCQCGSDIDAKGRHAMVCKKASGKIARHQVLNDVMWWALNAAGIPATKEPSGLNRQDGKRPDGLTLILWQDGKPLIWDITVASTLAASYADIAATGVGLVADQAADKRADKYADFTASYIFEPIAVENLGPLNASALEFISNLGQRISNLSGDDRETQFLFQRISVTIQRFNLVLLHDSFSMDPPDQ